MPPTPDDVPIGDYAIIGDCRSAALVSRHGGVDWLCWPRFDSPSLFGAILDRQRGGACRITPVGEFTATRRYLPGTAVLETTFRTPTGAVRVTDCMPVADDVFRRTVLLPDRQLLRVIDGVDGDVPLAIEFAPRPGYGARTPRLRHRGALGIFCEDRGGVLVMRSDVTPTFTDDCTRCLAQTTIHAGERRYLSLSFADRSEVVLPSLGTFVDQQIDETVRWWEQWSARCEYRGEWRDAVLRSAITLKLLCYAPSGAVVAAPTTSLPEQIGGARNWDYRYCWIRDASLTVQALFDLGYAAEAEAFLSWLVYTTRITRPRLQVMYDVYGTARLPERQLTHLTGYDRSRPVRVGNDAHTQLQLDVYGEVLDAIYAFERRGGTLDRSSRRMIHDWASVAAQRWNDADQGIWEFRTASEQHTYSLAMCWVALDRFVQLADTRPDFAKDAARFREVQDRIRECIESRGFNRRLGSYVSAIDGDDVDASLLMLARHGYAPADGPQMQGTFALIIERLGVNGLLYRYRREDGLPPGEGAFGICSFWAATHLALAGQVEDAAKLMDHLLTFGNDVGLFSEEIDPHTGAALGNVPQAFTHVGLIDAALTIEHHRGGAPRESGATTGEALA